ncbi:MAG: hypothetical protein PHO06_00895 [Clostridia bacterium]|jgi:mRNA-degrading endonuclease HigB of HigAB toxin-antitoxin module|nr:hypothetical protein [Clostridia bacterium]
MEKVNIMLLDDAYKNVRMGTYAINCIIDKIESKGLEDLMHKQNKFYLEITTKLDTFAKKNNYTPKDINAMLKASSYLSINMKTLMNKDTSHIAEMLIEGTTMGITTLVKEINQSPEADQELLALSNEIVSNQEEFVESLKKFL